MPWALPGTVYLIVTDGHSYIHGAFGCFAMITPPVALAAMAAAAIGNADLWETGWEAVKLSMIAFIVPFMFSTVLPLLVIVLPSMATVPESSSGDLATLINSFPVYVRNEIAGMTYRQAMIYIMSLYFFAPFFLIIFALVLVIGAGLAGSSRAYFDSRR
jgi:TRAP-type uncharacterized transport system fused permease subunit